MPFTRTVGSGCRGSTNASEAHHPGKEIFILFVVGQNFDRSLRELRTYNGGLLVSVLGEG